MRVKSKRGGGGGGAGQNLGGSPKEVRRLLPNLTFCLQFVRYD